MDIGFSLTETPLERGSFGIAVQKDGRVSVPICLAEIFANNFCNPDEAVPFLREFRREMTEQLGWTEAAYTKALAELDHLPEELTGAKLSRPLPPGLDGNCLEPVPIPAVIASTANEMTPGSFGITIAFTLNVPRQLAELLANNRIDRAAGVASFLTTYRKEVQEYLGWTDEQYEEALAELKRLPPWLRKPTPPGMDAPPCGVRP